MTTTKTTKTTNAKHLVRGAKSGVFYGQITAREGTEVTLADCRQVCAWHGAWTVADIAARGLNAKESKITSPAPSVLLLDAIEVCECSPVAVESINACPEWRGRP